MADKKAGKGNRKGGRNKVFCTAYKARGTREVNKGKRQRRHIKELFRVITGRIRRLNRRDIELPDSTGHLARLVIAAGYTDLATPTVKAVAESM